jgi:hypothetical protein
MKKIILLLILLFYGLSYAQTVDQKLLVIRNDGTIGGQLIVALQVKGTSLTAANTLGSATIDVQFNNTKLTYVSAANWAFDATLGYSAQATNNSTFVRVGTTGSGVNGTTALGFDIASTYASWVQLTFTILDTSVAPAFTIAAGSNAIGLFQSHSDSSKTNIIINQTLSTPVISIRATISGNAGVAAAVINYIDVSPLSVVADGTGAYSFTVPYGWSGTVTPALSGYAFTPPTKTYTNVKADQTLQNYTAAIVLPNSVQQQMQIIRNDNVVGGQVSVLYQVKGTNLSAANTLGSATADIQFDTSKLSYLSSTNWGFGTLQGYAAQVNNNTTFLRIGVTSSGVFPGTGGAAGIDITSVYVNWVQINFTIKNVSLPVALTIASATNAIGLFQNHANNTQTNIIINQTLTTPVLVSTPLISGNTGTGGVLLSYTDVTPKTFTSDSLGAYSFNVSNNWSGTVTPSKTGFAFSPASRLYVSVITDQINQNYVATLFVTVNVKAILEGAYNKAGGMTTTLNTRNRIPLTSDSAYANVKYAYTISTVTRMPNANVVDWVLVELRDSTTTLKSTVIRKRAGFLLNNGAVVDTDGVSPLFINSTPAGNYYVIIRHRNHLAVMSAAPLPLNSASALYDFTTSASQGYGANALDSLSAGVYGLIAGDSNGSGIVTIADISPILLNLNSILYLPGDINMSGITTIADLSLILEELNKSSNVPK